MRRLVLSTLFFGANIYFAVFVFPCLAGCQKIGEEIGTKAAQNIHDMFSSSHDKRGRGKDEGATKAEGDNVSKAQSLHDRHGSAVRAPVNGVESRAFHEKKGRKKRGRRGLPAVYVDSKGKIVRVDSVDKVPKRFRRTMIVMGSRLPDTKGKKRVKAGHAKEKKGTLERQLDKVISIWKNAVSDNSKNMDRKKQRKGNKVIMYQTSWCPACRAARSYMDKQGIDYTTRNVESDAVARKEFRKYGGRAVPLLVVNGKVIKGFDPNALEKALKK
ncbi:MAG: hypothetical protein GXP49_13330 [Deltaproteobacteria bacterium]|nr:hypothetical protein [Deltaproteobacteria bacterium]